MATGGLYGSTSTGTVAPQSGSESVGLYGNNTVFGGTYFEWFIFKEASTQPATPTGGSWNFTTNVGTAPAGWSSVPPAIPSNQVWVSIGVVNSRSTAAITWSAPGLFTFVNGTVTNVSALTLGTTGTDVSSTVANPTSTPVITLNLPTASATNRGLLSSSDWTTFNNKGSGIVTAVSIVSANGFAGTSSGGATPALTLSTSITGVVKGNGTALSAATAGTDYSIGTSALATGILKSTTTTGALSVAVAGDFPTLNQNTTGTAANITASSNATLTTLSSLSLPGSQVSGNISGNAANVTGTVAVANGGTGLTTTPVNGALDIGNGTGFTRTTLTAGTNVSITNTSGAITINSSNPGGTVTSVGLALPSIMSVSGSPVTSSGTLTGTLTTQSVNTLFAGPSSGAGATPTFRALVTADIPSLGYVTSVSGTSGNITSTGGFTPIINLASGIVAAGTTGSVTAIPVITVDTYGRVTSITTAANPQGTVTSVTGTSPVVSSGGATPAISLATAYGDTLNPYASKTANFVLAAPNGSAGVPTFRAIVAADIPTLNQNTTGTAANITATSNSTLTTLSALSLPYSQLSGTVPTWNQNTTGTAANVTGVVAVANGGSGVTISSGANSIVLRDANANITVNSINESFSNVAAAGTTTVLTASSAPNYVVTGSGGQTYQLPDATTLANGINYTFNNNQSSGTIVVKNNSSTTVATIQSGGFVEVILLSNSTAAGLWDVHNFAPSNVSWSTNTFDYPGSITSATWNGTAVAINRGGTGQTTAAAAITALAGTQTSGYYLRSNGTNTLLAAIVAGDVPTLNQNTTGTAANITATSNSTLTTLSTLSLPGSQVSGNISGNAANVTGTVAIGNGGTGQATAAAAFNALSPVTTTGDLIIGNGTNSSTRLGIGTNGYVLTSNGTTATWSAATGGVSQIIAGTNVTISPAGGTGVVTINASGGGSSSAYTRTTFTATAGQTAFTVAYAVGYLQIYVNGVLLTGSDYTATSGTNFTLNVACIAGDVVEALVITTSVTGVTTGKAIAMAMIFGY